MVVAMDGQDAQDVNMSRAVIRNDSCFLYIINHRRVYNDMDVYSYNCA